MNETFKQNNILKCNHCVVFNECEIEGKGEIYCPLEIEVYDRFMSSLNNDYRLNETLNMLAELLVTNIILSNRSSRYIKLKGITEKVKIERDGEIIEYDKENILKTGIHLDMNRIIRLLKEMKLTPKEMAPMKKQVEIKQLIMEVSRGLNDKSANKKPLRKQAVLPEVQDSSG